MNNKVTQIIIGIFLIAIVGAAVILQKENSLPGEASAIQGATQSGITEATSSPAVADGITIADVAAHASRESCWSIINGNVYDLTSWIPQHPGGERAILKLCGTDGSAAYTGQHGGAPKQAAILTGFKIGVAIQ